MNAGTVVDARIFTLQKVREGSSIGSIEEDVQVEINSGTDHLDLVGNHMDKMKMVHLHLGDKIISGMMEIILIMKGEQDRPIHTDCIENCDCWA